jgi:Trypsin-co-occurring domain 2
MTRYARNAGFTLAEKTSLRFGVLTIWLCWWEGQIVGGTDMSGVELASVIRQLRSELNEALDGAEGERLRFELGPVEVSLTVTVGREAAPGAKVRFWVIEAGADAKLSREAIQEIKLTLRPVDTQAPVSSDGKAAAPLIKGDAMKGER